MPTWPQTALNVARGALIGVVEVVPGVSGGTIALIVGVYETIITSAGHVISGLRRAVVDLPRGQGLRRASAEFRRADWPTLIPVAVGMVVALLLMARQVEGFVTGHPELARGLFLGLVAAALIVPISMVGRYWRPFYMVIAAVTTVAAFLLTGLPPTQVHPSSVVIVLSGAVAVSALILPGLSGSFILLTFGLYETTLAALNDRDLGYVGLFIAGMAVGLASFVKVLQWMLEHHRHLMLAILTGIMAGCMRALWPWQQDDRTLLAPGDNAAQVFLLALLGAVTVLTVLLRAHRVQRRREPKGAHARR